MPKKRGGHFPPRRAQKVLGRWDLVRRCNDSSSSNTAIVDCSHIAHLLHGYSSVMCMPSEERLNFNPPVCECSLITTPFSFLR